MNTKRAFIEMVIKARKIQKDLDRIWRERNELVFTERHDEVIRLDREEEQKTKMYNSLQYIISKTREGFSKSELLEMKKQVEREQLC